jgi:diguanylate cyclase (GGDEF)-like protein
VDLVADASTLGHRLAGLTVAGRVGETIPVAGDDGLPAITALLKRTTCIDFAGYKESTLQRQVQRRMAIRQKEDVNSYLAILTDDNDEAQALAGNLLVTVTSFFRDPEAFLALREHLTRYLRTADESEYLRVWVPGCATGEEVFTIAMLASEILGRPANMSQRLKIFGTDLDESSLAIARRAIYSTSAVSNIPEALRRVYTKQTSEGYQITEVLRECTVFARHDVSADPPFPRIDLVSCRNTMIYFKSALQQRVLGTFGFALRPGGLLMLGGAENLDRKLTGFRPADVEHRIFRRTSEPAPAFAPSFAAAPVRTPRRYRPGGEPVAAQGVTDPTLQHQVDLLEALLRQQGKSFLVLDDEHRLIEVVGDVGAYCRVAEGRMTGAVMSFLRSELEEEARALLLLSRTGSQPVVGRSIQLDNSSVPFRLVASRVSVGDSMFTILAFEPDEADGAAVTSPARGEDFDRELQRLEHELLMSQDTLRRSLGDLQAVNEELEASSEELQAASEELQAANEELQASNEELQATNEELGGLNRELTRRGDDLQRVTTDLENIQGSLSQGMVIVDEALLVTRFTPLAVRVFALMESDIGRPLLSAPTTVNIPGFEAALRGVVDGGSRVSIEAVADHTSYLVQILPYHVSSDRRIGAIITLTDVSEVVELRTRAERAFAELKDQSDLFVHEAKFDTVTGLVNRGHFSQLLNEAMLRASRSGEALALAWIDLDKFKEINDAHGHESGDVVLQVTGQRVLHSVRGSDAVGRLGGDEIGVLITGFTTTAELDLVLERIVSGIRENITVDEREVRPTASVGVALYPEDAKGPKDLMRAADAAMYAIKRESGDGYAYFDESMNEAASARRDRRHEISAAIERAEFVMHYQPIIDANNGVVWGVEALVRWEKDGELIPADQFVPFCEESGQIRALGAMTMALVRKDSVFIRAGSSRNLRISFNMSVPQLQDRHFAAALEEFARPNGLQGLVVEIVESVFLPDHGEALLALTLLSKLGAETSIDDYGSGYSNVRLLETLKPDYMKLDRSFLSSRHSVEGRSALIRSAVEIAHVVGSLVIAEGIETPEEHRLATEAGVDFVQGYGIARPMVVSDLMVWLKENEAAK